MLRNERRRELQCYFHSSQTDNSVDKATQTEIPMREVLVEIDDWHCCLNTSCFCILLLCMNLLYCQWLYLQTNFKTVQSILYTLSMYGVIRHRYWYRYLHQNDIFTGFTQAKNNLKGYYKILRTQPPSKSQYEQEYPFRKFSFFFQVLFLCYAVPSFVVQSYFCTYVATTKPVMLLLTSKQDANIFFMYPT